MAEPSACAPAKAASREAAALSGSSNKRYTCPSTPFAAAIHSWCSMAVAMRSASRAWASAGPNSPKEKRTPVIAISAKASPPRHPAYTHRGFEARYTCFQSSLGLSPSLVQQERSTGSDGHPGSGIAQSLVQKNPSPPWPCLQRKKRSYLTLRVSQPCPAYSAAFQRDAVPPEGPQAPPGCGLRSAASCPGGGSCERAAWSQPVPRPVQAPGGTRPLPVRNRARSTGSREKACSAIPSGEHELHEPRRALAHNRRVRARSRPAFHGPAPAPGRAVPVASARDDVRLLRRVSGGRWRPAEQRAPAPFLPPPAHKPALAPTYLLHSNDRPGLPDTFRAERKRSKGAPGFRQCRDAALAALAAEARP